MVVGNELIEIIKIVGCIIGYLLSAITLITMVVRPIRKKFIKWLKAVGGTDIIEENMIGIKTDFDELKQMLQTHIATDEIKTSMLQRLAEAEKASLRNSILHLCDMCLRKESITSIEKLNLIDMYKEYHNLGGDTYCTDRYEMALDLPEKN